VMLGARAAEELIFHECTTGAYDDLQRATGLARKMVMEWGMSTKLGPIALGKKHEQFFLGRDIMEERNYSEEVASQIDAEVRGIIETCYAASYALLEENIDKLHRLAEALLEHETVEGEDVDRLLSDAPQASPARKPETVVPEAAAAASAPPKEEKPRKAGGALPFPPPEPA